MICLDHNKSKMGLCQPYRLFPKNPLMFLWVWASFFLLSCGETPQQYNQSSVSPQQQYMPTEPFVAVSASHPNGGYLAYQKQIEITEELKDSATRERSLLPIDYKKGSVAGIHMETDYETARGILNPSFLTSKGLTVYKEGIAVYWRLDSPRTPDVIFVLGSYQGTVDFGPSLRDKRHARVGHSFASQFSIGEENQDILKDPKARHFITSLYKRLENTEEDCLESQSCSLSINPQGNYILFNLPKMVLLFGNNERRNLVQIALTKNDDPACFKSPFDLLSAEFSCERPDGSRVVFGLGDSREEVIRKSGVDENLPITYNNISLTQRTRSTIIGWKRNDFEEKTEKIPDSTHLSFVSMSDHEYNIPFLLNQSLIKVTLGEAHTVQLELEPLSPEGASWTMENIRQKLKEADENPSYFYLSNEMPQIKDQFILQKNLIEAFLSLLEENYNKFYSTEQAQPKIYSRLLGGHSDKFALNAKGLLIVNRPEEYFFDQQKEPYPFVVNISIDEHSGRMSLFMALFDDDFENYIIRNQKPALNLLEPLKELGGFKLGDRLYLRNKKMNSNGVETAIVAYPVSEDQTLFTLSDYYSESVSGAVYTSGRDKNIIYEKFSLVFVGGVDLYLRPTSQTRDIEGHTFDEFEIHKITVNGGSSFFGTVDSICGIEGLSAKIGMYDRTFQKRLVTQIAKARREASPDTPFKGCTYIAPQDALFSGLKRQIFFPSHNILLSFADREFYSVTINKKPTDEQGGEVRQ